MKLTIENKHKLLGKIVKHDIIMLLPELTHKGETYMFKGIDDLKRHYRWELTRFPMFGGRYQILFSDGQFRQQLVIDKRMLEDIDKFLYVCASMMPY